MPTSVTVDDFKRAITAGQDGDLVLDSGRVSSKGTGWGGKIAQWFRGVFSSREVKNENLRAMREFQEMIRNEYGDAMADMASHELDAAPGAPLTARTAARILGSIEESGAMPASRILKRNEMLATEYAFGSKDEFFTTFDVYYFKAVEEAQAKLGLGRLELPEDLVDKLRCQVFNAVLVGNARDPSLPVLIDRNQAAEIAEKIMKDVVLDYAEVKKGGFVMPRPEKTDSTESALKATLSTLTRRVVDRQALVRDAMAVTDQEERSGVPMGRLLDPALKEMSDAHLLRLCENLASDSVHDLLGGMGVQGQGTDPESPLYVQRAGKELPASAMSLVDLEDAARRELGRRGLALPEANRADVKSLADVAPDNRLLVKQMAEERTASLEAVGGVLAREALQAMANPKTERAGEKLLHALGGFRENSGVSPRPEDQFHFDGLLQQTLASELHRMPNDEFLRLYKGSLSTEMLELRLKLARDPAAAASSALCDLNTLEGMINMELADRAIIPDMKPAGSGEQPVNPLALHVSADLERGAFKRDLDAQQDSYLRGEPGVPHELGPRAAGIMKKYGVSAQQFTQLLQDSDFTINMGTETLCGKDSPFFAPDGSVRMENTRLLNTFELGAHKGAGYGAFRKEVEQMHFPALTEADRARWNPSNHPIAGALNAGGMIGGSAPSYGACFLVLKDEVKKERTGFMPRESFKLFDFVINRERIADFKARIHGLLASPPESMSPEVREAFQSEEFRNRFFAAVDKLEGRKSDMKSGGEVLFLIANAVDQALPAKFGDDLGMGRFPYRTYTSGRNLLENEALLAFVDRGTAPEYVSPYDRMEDLIAALPEEMVETLAQKRIQKGAFRADLSGYLEGQVFGGIDLGRDVKKIHVCWSDLKPGDLERARTLAQTLGVPLQFYDTNRKDTPVSYPPFPASPHAVDMSFGGFKKELPAILDQYTQQRADHPDLDGTHGRRHICRALMYSHAMANLMRGQGVPVDTHALYRGVAFHDLGREGEGEDRWEAGSAAKFEKHLKERGIQDPAYLAAARDCIVHRPDGSVGSVEAGLLQSADSLDIMRVYGRKDFDANKLWFMNHPVAAGGKLVDPDPQIVEKLMDEVSQFIELTDKSPRERTIEAALQKEEDPARQMEMIREMREEGKRFDREQESIPSGEFFQHMERVLLDNPEKFPTLVRYYTARS